MATVPPRVACEAVHPELQVADLPRAIAFYTTRLGFTVGFTWDDPPTYAGVDLDRVEVFLEPCATGRRPRSVSFVVDDVDALHDFHAARGVDVVEPLGDRPWGMRTYAVRDLDGNVLSFGQHRSDVGPPVEIERVDVPVRLERRLAGLLRDLAAMKRMSVDACLEEMILHTNEGVAPHTKAQLARIQDLKREHGIDYDAHASYRFVERR